MTDWILAVSYAICGAMLVMMVIGIAFSAFMPALDKWSRRYFIIFFSILFLYAAVLSVDVVIYYHPDMAAAQKAVNILEYIFFSVLTVMPMSYLLHCSGDCQKNSILFRAVTMLWLTFFTILVIGQFTDVFYFTASDNQYYRGPCFPMLMIPLAAIMILNIVTLFIIRKRISTRVFVAFLVYFLPTAILIIVFMFAPVDTMISFWIFLSALTMFGLVLMNNLKQYIQQQREIANQRASVMVLQMRPHFIYNTMMGIYYLCKQDSYKAQQVTLDFTTYLRKNFAAIASENSIPFSEELEHTRAYLAVEQAQFEDSLFVSFDTPHTLFRLPPLTLQPIVENAVKHCMYKSNDPIHISVITRQTDSANEIIVNDDGPGYTPVDDNEPHIALNNIRQRLEMMCRGELKIMPREGGGTVVKVTIPRSVK